MKFGSASRVLIKHVSKYCGISCTLAAYQQDTQVLRQELQSGQPTTGKSAGIVGLPTMWLHALKVGLGLCREFVVCIISEWFLEAANHTCGEYDKGCNEMELAGLTPEPSHKASFHAPIPACRILKGECSAFAHSR